MSKKQTKNNEDDGIVRSTSQEEKEKAEEVKQEVDEKTQAFYDKYEAIVNETGKIISPEIRFSQQGIYPVLTIIDVPKENPNNSAK